MIFILRIKSNNKLEISFELIIEFNNIYLYLTACLAASKSKPMQRVDIPVHDWPTADFPCLKYPLHENEAENREIENQALDTVPNL